MRPREELIQLMHQAKAFREPIVKQYLEVVEQNLFKDWQKSTDIKEREKIYLQGLALKEFQSFIRRTIIDGENAEKEINAKLEKEQALTK